MTDLLSIQTALCLIFILVVSNEQLTAFANDSCQVYPSEYAYHRNSVFGSERSSANCRPYTSNLGTGSFTENYNHCNGTQLKLTDSDLGPQQYSSSDYYVWNAQDSGSSGHRLLFIFPTRVNLSTITLHYYYDNIRGLPRLRFYAVPDDYNVWTAVSASYNHVDIAAVSPDAEPAGRRNVSVNFDFISVQKVLLFKLSSSFIFAASEVQFFTNSTRTPIQRICTTVQTTTTFSSIRTSTTAYSTGEPTEISSATIQKTTIFSSLSTSTVKEPTTETTNEPNATDSYNDINSTENRAATGDKSTDTVVAIGTGIAIAIAMILLLTVIAATVLVLMRRSVHKRKVDYVDSSYSTLCRESGQQMQSQSHHTSNDLYDQIQLSPSTGQAEFISRNETANTNNSPPHQTEYGIHPSVDKDKPKSAKLKITTSTISTHCQDEDKSTSEQPTYAVVNKKKKQKTEKESVHCQSKDIAEVSQNESVSEQNAVEHGNYLQESQDSPDTTTQYPSQTIDSPQELYTAVKKKPKDRPVEDKKVPTIFPYTTEELYTAVMKKPHASTAGDDEEAPQIPPHTIEELYTAVQKKPKANATVDEEEAPPVPAHTVEELYTAVVKKPKVSTAENEEEAPPIPPYTVEEL